MTELGESRRFDLGVWRSNQKYREQRSLDAKDLKDEFYLIAVVEDSTLVRTMHDEDESLEIARNRERRLRRETR